MASFAVPESRAEFRNLHYMLNESGYPLVLDSQAHFICSENKAVVTIPVSCIRMEQEIQVLEDEEGKITYILHLPKTNITAPPQVEVAQNKVATAEEGLVAQLPETIPHSASSSDSEEHSSSKLEWPVKITKFLINKYEIYNELKKERKIKCQSEIFSKISGDLWSQKKFKSTPDQVRNKWRSMNRGYKKMVDNNKKTGRGRKDCAFQKELAPILERDPSVNPQMTADPSGIVKWQNEVGHEDKDEDSDEDEAASTAKKAKMEKKLSTKLSLELLREDMETRAKDREVERQRRHSEKMQREDVRNDLLRRRVEIMEKLEQRSDTLI